MAFIALKQMNKGLFNLKVLKEFAESAKKEYIVFSL